MTKLKGKVMFLTSRKAKEWKVGKWKYTYTNFIPTTKYLLCFSGDYYYTIRLFGLPSVILFNRVPKGYRECLDSSKIVYKTKARLLEVVPRKLKHNPTQKNSGDKDGK